MTHQSSCCAVSEPPPGLYGATVHADLPLNPQQEPHPLSASAQGNPEFMIRQGPYLFGSIVIDAPDFVVGRSNCCAICLPDVSVSRQHFRIQLSHQGYILRDLESGNGTTVNGQQTISTVLHDQDRIRAGIFEIQIHLPRQCSTKNAQDNSGVPQATGDAVVEDVDAYFPEIASESFRHQHGNLPLEKMFAWGKIVTLYEVILAEKNNLKDRIIHYSPLAGTSADEHTRQCEQLSKARRALLEIALVLLFDERVFIYDYVVGTALPPKMREGLASLFRERLVRLRTMSAELVAYLEKDSTIRDAIRAIVTFGRAIRAEIEEAWQHKYDLLTYELNRFVTDNERLESALLLVSNPDSANRTDARDQKRIATIIRIQRKRISEYRYYVDCLGKDPRHALSLIRTDMRAKELARNDLKWGRPQNEFILILLKRQYDSVQSMMPTIPEILRDAWKPQLFQNVSGPHTGYCHYFAALALLFSGEQNAELIYKAFLQQCITSPELVDFLELSEQARKLLMSEAWSYQAVLNSHAQAFFTHIEAVLNEGGSPLSEIFRDFYRQALFSSLDLLTNPDITDLLIKVPDGVEMIRELCLMCTKNSPASAMLFEAFLTVAGLTGNVGRGIAQSFIDTEVPLRRQMVRLGHLEDDQRHFKQQHDSRGTIGRSHALPNLVEVKLIQSRIVRKKGLERSTRRLSHRLEEELRTKIRKENRWYGWMYSKQLDSIIERKLLASMDTALAECDTNQILSWSASGNRWPGPGLERTILDEVLAEAKRQPALRKKCEHRNTPSPFEIFDYAAVLHDIDAIKVRGSYFHYIRSQLSDVARLNEVEDMVSAAHVFLQSNEFGSLLKSLDDNIKSLRDALGQSLEFEPTMILEEVEEQVKELNKIIEDFNTNIAFFNKKLREEERFFSLLPIDVDNVQLLRKVVDATWCAYLLSTLWGEPSEDGMLLQYIAHAMGTPFAPAPHDVPSNHGIFVDVSLASARALSIQQLRQLLPTDAECAPEAPLAQSTDAADQTGDATKLVLCLQATLCDPLRAAALARSGFDASLLDNLVGRYESFLNTQASAFFNVLLAMKGDVFRSKGFLVSVLDSHLSQALGEELDPIRKRLDGITTTEHAQALEQLSETLALAQRSGLAGRILALLLCELSQRYAFVMHQ